MHYNVPPPPDFTSFNISTHTMAKCNVSRPQLIVFVHVRYSLRQACVRRDLLPELTLAGRVPLT